MVQADQVSDVSAGNTTICIIDSGYHIAHEDLASGANVNGTNNPGTGKWNEDACGQGTHVASGQQSADGKFHLQLQRPDLQLH